MSSMPEKGDYFKFVFGLKIKTYRQKKKLQVSELSRLTGLSISYLSEIEKGLKYPKPEKIILLSKALGVSFDELVTVRLSGELSHFEEILNSPLWDDIPLEQFGISLHDVLQLLTDSRTKAGALIKTLYGIGRQYEMQGEYFMLAALRTLQELNENYFSKFEDCARQFIVEFSEKIRTPDPKNLTRLLEDNYNVTCRPLSFEKYPELSSFRSIYKNQGKKGTLWINPNLNSAQVVFLLLKEIGFHYSKVIARPTTFNVFKPENFEIVYNNFMTSYFAGAVLMPENEIEKDLRNFFSSHEIDINSLIIMLSKYNVNPETLLHRFSQLVCKKFGFKRFHYMRFISEDNSPPLLDKELNYSDVFTAKGFFENHCARWLSVKSLGNFISEKPAKSLGIYAQRSTFMNSGQEFFNISICRHMSLKTNTVSSMTLGLLVTDEFRKQVKFWNSKLVPTEDVNETCERCNLSPEQCKVRRAEPIIYIRQQREREIQDSLNRMLEKA